MELAHSLLLNEEAFKKIPENKRPVFVFEWLRFLDKVLSAAQKVSIRIKLYSDNFRTFPFWNCFVSLYILWLCINLCWIFQGAGFFCCCLNSLYIYQPSLLSSVALFLTYIYTFRCFLGVININSEVFQTFTIVAIHSNLFKLSQDNLLMNFYSIRFSM